MFICSRFAGSWLSFYLLTQALAPLHVLVATAIAAWPHGTLTIRWPLGRWRGLLSIRLRP